MPLEIRREARALAAVLGLAALYFGAGKAGLTLAFVQANATAVWPPTGIALAAVLLFGYRVWPGIFLGAFLVNLTTAGSVTTSLGIATGNTLEALTGAFLVNRFANGLQAFQRSVDVFKFAFLAGAVGTLVSPTLGVSSLFLGGYAPHARYTEVWMTWWLGDLGGALLVAPLLILGAGHSWHRISKAVPLLEFTGLLACLVAVCWTELGGQTGISRGNYPLEILFIPPLVWAAIRFGPLETAFTSFLTTIAAVFGTLHGYGPFRGSTQNESLLLLQSFMSVTGVMVLALAANVSERREAQAALQRSRGELEDRVRERTQDLQEKSADLELMRKAAAASNQAATLEEALETALAAVCTHTGWPVGHVYVLSEASPPIMAPTRIWHLSDPDRYAVFRERTEASYFKPGEGLPGRILSSGRSQWITDVAEDNNFPRLKAAALVGLKGAFGFPVMAHHRVTAVLEFFTEEKAKLEQAFLDLVDQVGAQLGRVVERQRAAQALEQSEKYFRTLIENALDIMTLLAPDGTILFESNSVTRFLGYTPGERQGTNAFGLVHPEDLPSVQAVFGELLGVPGGIRSAKFRYRHQNGSWRILESTGSNLLGVEAVKAVLVNSRDVTAEEEARKAILEKEELTRSNKDLEQFAYVASHDLQEPLRMVASYVQLLARQYKGRLDGEADQYIHEAVDGAKRMQTLILDLLAYSRLDSAGQPFVEVDCGKALHSALSNLERTMTESRAEVHQGPLPPVHGDPNQIIQLFQNLIGNAVKFRGGHAPEIQIEAVRQGGDWLFSVQDNGIGIDPKYKEQIFEVFKRLHTRAEYPGTGIGLAICKKVVARHGGRIWVESRPGEGSTFYWTLPAVPARKEPEHVQSPAAQRI